MYGLLSFFRYNSWGPIECGDKKWIKVVGSTKCEDKNDVDQLISLKKITKNSLYKYAHVNMNVYLLSWFWEDQLVDIFLLDRIISVVTYPIDKMWLQLRKPMYSIQHKHEIILCCVFSWHLIIETLHPNSVLWTVSKHTTLSFFQ